MTSTARRVIPAASSTSRSGTPRQRATPIAPSVHWLPGTGVPCWEAKKLRPLPAHSMNAVTSREGMRRSCGSENETPSGRRSPLPNTCSP
jgi:hypothetical protein